MGQYVTRLMEILLLAQRLACETFGSLKDLVLVSQRLVEQAII
jgi:hypothetical protein